MATNHGYRGRQQAPHLHIMAKRPRTGANWQFYAVLPCGWWQRVSVSESSTVGDLKEAVQQSLGGNFLRLTSPDGWPLDDLTESLKLAGLTNGDAIGIVAQPKVAVTSRAFAVWYGNGGPVITWGDLLGVGDSSEVQVKLRNIQQICAANNAFAAILADGSVVTRGMEEWGRDSSDVHKRLRNVQQIHATKCAFVAILADGSVVPLGDFFFDDGYRLQKKLRNM